MNVDELQRIPMSPHLAEALARASAYAGSQGHIEVSLEHLLLALTEDADAGQVLTASNVDLARLSGELSGYLGNLDARVPEGASAGLVAGPDLKRILEATAAAAAKGRRREINGAIVLAAIVGDGKSSAAHLLRAQGLTFEEAIRVLQRPPAGNQGSGGQGAQQVPSTPAPAPSRFDAAEAGGYSEVQPPADVPNTIHPDTSRSSETLAERPLAAADRPVAVARGGARGQPDRVAAGPRSQPQPHPQTQPELPAARVARAIAPRDMSREPASHELGPASGWPGQATIAGQWPNAAPGADQTTSMAPPPGPPAPNRTGPVRAGQLVDPTSRPHRAAQPAEHGDTGPGFGPSIGSSIGPAMGPPPGRAMATHSGQGPSYREPPLPPHPVYTPLSADGSGRLMPRLAPAGPGPEPWPGGGPGGEVELGDIAENIPRKWKVGDPVGVEVRIGNTAAPGEIAAVAVRLACPGGGFLVEPHTPETQWIDPATPQVEEYSSWRWTLTPLEPGAQTLVLQTSARAVRAGQSLRETRLEDQPIEVSVAGRGRVRAMLGRLAVFALAIGLGIGLASLAPTGFPAWMKAAIDRSGG